MLWPDENQYHYIRTAYVLVFDLHDPEYSPNYRFYGLAAYRTNDNRIVHRLLGFLESDYARMGQGREETLLSRMRTLQREEHVTIHMMQNRMEIGREVGNVLKEAIVALDDTNKLEEEVKTHLEYALMYANQITVYRGIL